MTEGNKEDWSPAEQWKLTYWELLSQGVADVEYMQARVEDEIKAGDWKAVADIMDSIPVDYDYKYHRSKRTACRALAMSARREKPMNIAKVIDLSTSQRYCEKAGLDV